jgi:hypothetical protein
MSKELAGTAQETEKSTFQEKRRHSLCGTSDLLVILRIFAKEFGKGIWRQRLWV